MNSILLTPEKNRFQLFKRDGISIVRIDRLVSENEMSFTHFPALSLAVFDDANLVLWSEELHTYVQADTPKEASIGRDFSVWDSLTIGINTRQEPLDFCIRLYYINNPSD